MIRSLSFRLSRRVGSLQFSALMLITLLQRTPVLRLLAAAESAWVSSSLGQVLKASAVVATLLGAVDTLAGATGLTADPMDPAEATVGVSFQAAFAYAGGPTTVDSYRITNLPPGLTVPGSSASGATRILNGSTGTITGTPTQAGQFNVSITACDAPNGASGQHPNVTSTYTIIVAAGNSNTAPSISAQPANVTVTAGAPASFSVTATGNPAPTFQWQKNNVNISGATNSTFTIASTVGGDAATYRVVVTNTVSSVNSNGATLTVNTVPAVTNQPANLTVTAGQPASFTVSASGSPTPAIQWQKNNVNIPGATSTTFTIASTVSGDAATYRAVVTNVAGSANSNGATLTVNPVTNAPVITTQPVSQGITAGSPVTFSAAASGNPTPTFQWRKNGGDIPGATNTTFTIAVVQAGDAGSYSVVATNSVNSATSNAAVLTVNVVPGITTQPASQTVVVGNAVTFTVAATGSPAPAYQWKKAGVAIGGATASSYTITTAAEGDAGSYTVVVTNVAGSLTSSAATLTVITSVKSDFNFDGKPDLIWSNSVTGERALWLMDGTQYIAASTLGIFPLEWTVVATGDFNFDGKPDLVWSNSVTGERALWLMNGTQYIAASTLGVFPLEWTIAATGDFNFDTKPDIVWSNSVTGERALWLMDGTQYIAASTLGIFPLEWTVAATGDFNFDGKPDIVWSNSVTGERALWLMDGTQYIAASTLGIFPLEWTVAGVGDYNADGKPDIIWSNSVTGERALWLMNGTQYISASSLGIFPLEWTVGN